MSLRLINQRDPQRTLSLNKDAWFHILELAEQYGWNPLGTVQPERVTGEPDQAGYDPDEWSETSDHGARLVLLEDALNLADALEKAFLEHNPDSADRDLQTFHHSPAGLPPGIGVILATLEFCRDGAFWIENQA